jgi:ribose transport system substrate-binding protein
MGKLGVETLVRHIKGTTVEPRIDTGVTMATPDNMNDGAIKSLLFPEMK